VFLRGIGSKRSAKDFDLSKLTLNKLRYARINEHDARHCRLVAVFDGILFDGMVTCSPALFWLKTWIYITSRNFYNERVQ
jgi:hypothetical protein